MKQGYYFFLWKVPTIGGVFSEIYSFLPLLVQAPGGGNDFEKSPIPITPSTPTRLTLEIAGPRSGPNF